MRAIRRKISPCRPLCRHITGDISPFFQLILPLRKSLVGNVLRRFCRGSLIFVSQLLEGARSELGTFRTATIGAESDMCAYGLPLTAGSSCRPPRFPLPSGQAGGRSSRGLQRPASRREHGGLDMLLIADTEAIIPTEGIAGPFTPDDRRAETARILEKDRKTALIASAVAAPDTGPMVIMLRASAHAPS